MGLLADEPGELAVRAESACARKGRVSKERSSGRHGTEQASRGAIAGAQRSADGGGHGEQRRQKPKRSLIPFMSRVSRAPKKSGAGSETLRCSGSGRWGRTGERLRLEYIVDTGVGAPNADVCVVSAGQLFLFRDRRTNRRIVLIKSALSVKSLIKSARWSLLPLALRQL